MRFKGHDYTELIEYFNLRRCDDDDREAQWLQAFLNANQEKDEVVAACREYVDSLAEQCEKYCYSGPLWRGLLAVEDDITFIQYFSHLVSMAWS